MIELILCSVVAILLIVLVLMAVQVFLWRKKVDNLQLEHDILDMENCVLNLEKEDLETQLSPPFLVGGTALPRKSCVQLSNLLVNCFQTKAELALNLLDDPKQADKFELILETDEGAYSLWGGKESIESSDISQHGISINIKFPTINVAKTINVLDAYVIHGCSMCQGVPEVARPMEKGDCLKVKFKFTTH